MYEFWYDYGKSKYNKKAKLCYMDTDSFVVHVKTEDIFKSIAKYVKERYDTWVKKTSSKRKKTKKIIGLMKDELGGKIMKEFVGLIAKAYNHTKIWQHWK